MKTSARPFLMRDQTLMAKFTTRHLGGHLERTMKALNGRRSPSERRASTRDRTEDLLITNQWHLEGTDGFEDTRDRGADDCARTGRKMRSQWVVATTTSRMSPGSGINSRISTEATSLRVVLSCLWHRFGQLHRRFRSSKNLRPSLSRVVLQSNQSCGAS